jgi:DNA-directed RNA polymerase specialized sigma24 family protein
LQLAAERRKAANRTAILDLTVAEPPAAGDTEAKVQIRQALEKLAPDDREVLMLREYE